MPRDGLIYTWLVSYYSAQVFNHLLVQPSRIRISGDTFGSEGMLAPIHTFIPEIPSTTHVITEMK
jgi:hypothetical protein